MKMRKIWLIMFQKSSHIEIGFLKKILVSFLSHLFLNSEKFIWWHRDIGDKFLTRVTKFKCVTNNLSPTSMSLNSSPDYHNARVIKMKLLLTKNETNVPSENRKSFQSCKRSFIWYSFGFNPCFKILTSSISNFFSKFFL